MSGEDVYNIEPTLLLKMWSKVSPNPLFTHYSVYSNPLFSFFSYILQCQVKMTCITSTAAQNVTGGVPQPSVCALLCTKYTLNPYFNPTLIFFQCPGKMMSITYIPAQSVPKCSFTLYSPCSIPLFSPYSHIYLQCLGKMMFITYTAAQNVPKCSITHYSVY